jgi:hypothetical protein
MFTGLNQKFIPLAPASVASNATATLIVDRRGFDEATFCVVQANGADTTAPLVLNIAQGDTTSAFTTITGYNGNTTTSSSFTLPSGPSSATAAPPIILNVDCEGKARYLRLQMTPGTTQVLGAVCVLGRPSIGPDSANEIIATQGTNGAHGTVTTSTGLVVGPEGRIV